MAANNEKTKLGDFFRNANLETQGQPGHKLRTITIGIKQEKTDSHDNDCDIDIDSECSEYDLTDNGFAEVESVQNDLESAQYEDFWQHAAEQMHAAEHCTAVVLVHCSTSSTSILTYLAA